MIARLLALYLFAQTRVRTCFDVCVQDNELRWVTGTVCLPTVCSSFTTCMAWADKHFGKRLRVVRPGPCGTETSI